jgi:hypothetical protein
MSRCGKNVLVAFATLLLALPLAARSRSPKNSKSIVRSSVELTQDVTLAGKQLKAGTYQVRANESTLTLLQKGKVVAEAPIEWKPEGKGVSSSGVVTDSGAVKEIHFIGKTRYAEIAPQGESGTAEGHE